MSKPTVVQTRGVCDRGYRHDEHTFITGEYPTHWSVWACPGQYADCRNCDDRQCMDCVLRVVHDRCEKSCPDCCGPVSDSILAHLSMN